MSETYYTPGVCNINREEVKNRRSTFYLGIATAFSLLGLLYILDVSAVVGIIIFVPVWLGALGYLQARYKFCVGYAAAGKYSNGDKRGQTANVDKRSSHGRDKLRAKQINRQAQIIGLLGAGLAIFILAIT